ncbi:MAG: hypothetical protein ACYS47_02090 [Planctomycetota bacterium]
MKASEPTRAGATGRVFTPTPAEGAVLGALTVLAGLLLLPFPRHVPDPVFTSREGFVHRIDVLEGGAGELLLLPGVGPHRAKKILQARREAAVGAGPMEVLEAAGLPVEVTQRLEPWIRPGGSDGSHP